ncbi:MAG: hypothetical protein J0M04_12730 [Verrucomicrobia bacterium]|nr:hypothetical protein [Verrucomicrobiota bacterium]
MKRPSHIDESARFRGGLKHYHRSGSQPQSSWDQWVDGESEKTPRKPWLKIAVVVLGVAALIGIGVALYIELATH